MGAALDGGTRTALPGHGGAERSRLEVSRGVLTFLSVCVCIVPLPLYSDCTQPVTARSVRYYHVRQLLSALLAGGAVLPAEVNGSLSELFPATADSTPSAPSAAETASHWC